MNNVINISDVGLKTATVTLKTITVSGKQMTLAVFRQLRIGQPDEGEPWGIVNYSIKDQGKVWLVYSHDATLKRRVIPIREPSKSSIRWAQGIIDTLTSLDVQKMPPDSHIDHYENQYSGPSNTFSSNPILFHDQTQP